MKLKLVVLCAVVCLSGLAQGPYSIQVEADRSLGPSRPLWAYFGYDEPNYTYAKNGVKLIGELGALRQPVYIRVHNLLTTGDGTPALKWGSTNAYTEDASGRPVYNWTIVDRIFDTMIQAKAKPFVEIGFMPQALSVKPEPYQHSWPKTKIAAGWAYPPNDYGKWSELVFQWVRHSVARYGRAEVSSWYWEVWNEPDIEYWQGTSEEYDKLYDYAVDAVKRALPEARVGGPASTGPAGEKAASFLRQFLQHCERGTNGATGSAGAPLDFIAFHAKGRPSMADQHVVMGLKAQLTDVARGLEIVTSFPKFRALPIILSESDPEGCAACSARTAPQNAYRNGALYPCYTADAMSRLLELADQYHANLEGMLTWAFEFEGQPPFEGFRTLATDGIDKPILNVFRMAALMDGDRLPAQSSGALKLGEILQGGVRGNPDIGAMAARAGRKVSVLIWNYHDVDIAGPDAAVNVTIEGLPTGVRRATMRHFRIDRDHSNAFTVWQRLGSPASPSAAQFAELEAAGQLQMLAAPARVSLVKGKVALPFTLPRQGISLVQVEW